MAVATSGVERAVSVARTPWARVAQAPAYV